MHALLCNWFWGPKKKQNTFGCDHNHLPYFRRLNVLQFELQSIWLMIKCTVLFPFISLFTVSVDSIYSMQAMHALYFGFFFLFSFFIGADSLKMQLEMHLLNFGILFLVYSAPFSVDSVLFFIFFSAVAAHFHSREESNRKTIKIVSCNRHKHRQLNRNTLRLETLDCLLPLWCNTCNLACSKFHCCNFKNLNWILRYRSKMWGVIELHWICVAMHKCWNYRYSTEIYKPKCYSTENFIMIEFKNEIKHEPY